MGRVAASRDHARTEFLHAIPQQNVPNTKKWETRVERPLPIVTWMELTYRRRLPRVGNDLDSGKLMAKHFLLISQGRVGICRPARLRGSRD